MKNPNCKWCGIVLTESKIDSPDFGKTYFCGECYDSYKENKNAKGTEDSIYSVIQRINQPGYVEACRDCVDMLDLYIASRTFIYDPTPANWLKQKLKEMGILK